MKGLSRIAPLAFAVSVAVAIACGGDSSGPSGPQAASVTGIAGDNQVAPTGALLDFPLSLTVLGSNGQPVQGVNVTWTVSPINRVTFSPDTSPSDVNGVVTTNVTAGSTPATVLLQAHVPGIQQPVDFHVQIVDPCQFAVVHPLGSSVNATLTTQDCRVTVLGTPFYWYYDFYALTLPTQTGVTINMTASFDTYLDFYQEVDGSFIGFNDDIASSNFNSRFEAILPAGVYIIGANTADTAVTGPYTLASTNRGQAIDNCPHLWVIRGVVINDNISTTDCADTTGVGSYGDTLLMVAEKGSTVKIAQRSAAVDANLRLFQRVFSGSLGQPDTVKLVASNNDSSATTTNAFVSYTIPLGGSGSAVLLEIFAGTSGIGQTGAYMLDISASTTLSGLARSAPRSGWGFSLGSRPIPQLGLRRRL